MDDNTTAPTPQTGNEPSATHSLKRAGAPAVCHTIASKHSPDSAPADALLPQLSPATAARSITVTLNPAIDRTVSISNFTAGEVNRAEKSADKAGGKGVNVAIALAKAGAVVTATGLLGRENHAIFTEAFQANGITDAFCLLDGQTRLGIKIVDPRAQQTTDINFPGLQPTAASLEQVKTTVLAAVRAQTPFVALGGSLPPGVDAALYAAWITELKAAGARVALDTSGAPLKLGIAAGPTFIKPNKDELQALLGQTLGTPTEIARAARQLINTHGIGLVAVSMGAEGACFISAEAAVHAHSIPIPIYSTVGAGDAMVAGILHALNPRQGANASLDTIARHGIAFSLATLEQPPAQEAAQFCARIRHWLPQIDVRPLHC